VGRDLEQSFDAIAHEIINEANALEAELEATQVQIEIEQAKTEAEYEAKKSGLTEKIHWFKNEVSDKTQLAAAGRRSLKKIYHQGWRRSNRRFPIYCTNLY